jgi:adenylosuccinate lyase
MKGSSAMPHKRNPKVAERISGLARVVRAAAGVGLENMPLWHERDISHSSAERIVVPDAFLALDYMLDRFTWIVDGLVVHPERMERNLWASHGLFFSHRLLLALVANGSDRADAYRIVQRNAMRAWDEELDFARLVRADTDVASLLAPPALDEVFDLDATIANLDRTFDRLHQLTTKEEPAHV